MISSSDVAADCKGVDSNEVRLVFEPRQHEKMPQCFMLVLLILQKYKQERSQGERFPSVLLRTLCDSRTRWHVNVGEPTKKIVFKNAVWKLIVDTGMMNSSPWDWKKLLKWSEHPHYFLLAGVRMRWPGFLIQKVYVATLATLSFIKVRLILSTLPKQHCNWPDIFTPALSHRHSVGGWLFFPAIKWSEELEVLATLVRQRGTDETGVVWMASLRLSVSHAKNGFGLGSRGCTGLIKHLNV